MRTSRNPKAGLANKSKTTVKKTKELKPKVVEENQLVSKKINTERKKRKNSKEDN